MKIQRNYDLTNLNTFGITVRADFFVELEREEDIKELFSLPEFRENKRMFLGSGSNILFTQDFSGIIILNKLRGTRILSENENEVVIRALSGEIWHDLVNFTVDRGYWGIENLSFIPGTVGAAPMQNIGAYGAELGNVLENVEAVEISSGLSRTFKKEECRLGYRDSIFKRELKDKYFILAITLKLSKRERKNISYKALKEYLEKNNIEIKNPRDISKAVTYIRKTKLPDPGEIGNAGSFFKNVFVTESKLKDLQKIYPDIPHFKESGLVKIPSAWLVEQCGFRGKKQGGAGVHERQPLVLVNHGGAKGADIKHLAEQISSAVYEKFGLRLEPEVNIL